MWWNSWQFIRFIVAFGKVQMAESNENFHSGRPNFSISRVQNNAHGHTQHKWNDDEWRVCVLSRRAFIHGARDLLVGFRSINAHAHKTNICMDAAWRTQFLLHTRCSTSGSCQRARMHGSFVHARRHKRKRGGDGEPHSPRQIIILYSVRECFFINTWIGESELCVRFGSVFLLFLRTHWHAFA